VVEIAQGEGRVGDLEPLRHGQHHAPHQVRAQFIDPVVERSVITVPGKLSVVEAGELVER